MWRELRSLARATPVGPLSALLRHPPHYGVELTDRAAIAAAVFDVQQRYGISDRRLIDEAKVSHHTLAGLKEGKRIADASLMKLFRAAEALRQEADPVAAAMDNALKELRRLKEKVGGRNKLADLLGISRPYVGRVLKGEKPMTEDLARRIQEISRAEQAGRRGP